MDVSKYIKIIGSLVAGAFEILSNDDVHLLGLPLESYTI